ncbi:hypothetical protein QUW03_07875 [Faecalicoccus acidiformans]|uniref:hypothetical protein n=1 Tax=Faecalicoccus acidiformans TaxID=915173 RepID=UPI0025A3B12F|nr:hypothetical protein [Faecalicoccus acidiformans]MDM8204286.1 hypothetical protein [Faecalicoccus acidiformans]
METPANKIPDGMWDFLKDGNQKANVKALKTAVYTLIGMSTQKTAGQRLDHPKHISFGVLEILKWKIICEAVALVLSGKLDEMENEKEFNEL